MLFIFILNTMTIQDFNQRFDAAYDLRLYHQSKGYTDMSIDWCEYSLWQPQDPTDLESGELAAAEEILNTEIEEF